MDRRAWFLLACVILIPWQIWHIANHPQFMRPPLPIGDGPDYESIGYSLSIGRGFSFAWSDPQWKAPYLSDKDSGLYSQLNREANTEPTTVRPPLVPLVIAGIYRVFERGPIAFAVYRCVSAFAIGISGAIAVMLAYDITRKMTSADWVAHVAAVVAMILALLDRTIQTYVVDFLSEPLALLWTSLFLTVGLHLTGKRKSESAPRSRLYLRGVVLLAMLMALMVATRSMFVFWIPGVLVLLLLSLQESKLRQTIVFATLVTLFLSPWWIRNCILLESFMPMGAQGAPSIMGGYSDGALADHGNWSAVPENHLRQILKSSPDASRWSNLEFERRLARAASIETRQWIQQHRSELPYLIWLRLQTHWGPYFGKSLLWRGGMTLGVIALLFHRRRESFWMIGMPVVSSLTVMMLYETGGRFLVPLYGLLYALAAIGVAKTLEQMTIGLGSKHQSTRLFV